MLNYFNIMIYSLLPHFFINVLHRPEFITVLLAGLILECIGVHSIKTQPMLCRQCLNGWGMLRNIPGDMQEYGTEEGVKGREHSYIYCFDSQARRLASAEKPAKADTAG